MPFLLRSTKYNKWITDEPDWLEDGETPADPIFGLDTKSNTMSVWAVESHEDQLDRIIAALAATRQSLQDFEYVLLDSQILTLAQIRSRKTEGKSPDAHLNSLLHRDLIEISAQKLVKLTAATFKTIQQEGENTKVVERVPRKVVAKYIVECLRQGHLNPAAANAKVLQDARELVGGSPEQVPPEDQ